MIPVEQYQKLAEFSSAILDAADAHGLAVKLSKIVLVYEVADEPLAIELLFSSVVAP